jgi:hypothetical protein
MKSAEVFILCRTTPTRREADPSCWLANSTRRQTVFHFGLILPQKPSLPAPAFGTRTRSLLDDSNNSLPGTVYDQ